ncbi:morphogenic membrane protein MmpA [Streptomyces beigongshangae]|nr:hypothetical protein [Streptomyces sp. REN17]
MTTTHRAPKPAAGPGRPVGRAVTAGLVLSVVTGIAWTAGMVHTVIGWRL